MFQHVPVERCRELICDAAGAQVSAGFIHSCLRKAADLAADVIKLIKTLIIAAGVAGFDETTLRAGPGQKKYVLGAFTEEYSLLHLGARDPRNPSATSAILTGLRRHRRLCRYVNYFHDGWQHIAGHQACLSHYPDTVVMPICGRPLLVTGVTGLAVSA